MHFALWYNFVYTTLPIAGCYGLMFCALLHTVFHVRALFQSRQSNYYVESSVTLQIAKMFSYIEVSLSTKIKLFELADLLSS